MTAFESIYGQDTAIETLARAVASGRVHHAYRFEGPPSVGKDKTASAFAQTLLCDRGTGCGECSACHRVETLSTEPPFVPLHPDVVLVQRGLYAGTLLSAKEATGISVEQIRKIVLGRVGFSPHEGKALVVIVRDADELTTQAANALLKTLEEPHEHVHFVLVTSRPNRLLDTVRSRTLSIRFGPLPDAAIEKILSERGKTLDAVGLAGGSAQAALDLTDGAQREQLLAFARAVETAVALGPLTAALDLAAELPRERSILTARLLDYAGLLAVETREHIASEPDRSLGATLRHAAVQDALLALERNAAPQITIEAMIAQMRQDASSRKRAS